MAKKRCNHRYKGLYGNYQPRMRRTRTGCWVTDYKCQIIVCNHWKLNYFRSKI